MTDPPLAAAGGGPYNPENTLAELRRVRRSASPALLGTLDRTAAHLRDNVWPTPDAQEAAGMGIVVAIATLAQVVKDHPGGNAVSGLYGLLGLTLVEGARTTRDLPDAP